MKRLLLAGTAFLGLAASGSVARATLFDFTYSGSLVDFTVPTTDTYQILAFGAQGGSSAFNGFVGTGGRGAEIGGDFSLTAGEVLRIAVGGTGGDSVGNAGGGGGGSFVVADNTPLVIAGGGGGGSAFAFGPAPGDGGLTGPDGSGTGGGTNGDGGSFGFSGGGGGGGFFSPGGTFILGAIGVAGRGGDGFPGLSGGAAGNMFGGDGGFGGGGGGGSAVHTGAGGGGGGGYSGGAGGYGIPGSGGGGGGSFDAGTDQILVADYQAGNGEVVITEVAIPEPASIALLGAGLAGLAVVWRRRRPWGPLGYAGADDRSLGHWS